MAVIGAHMLVYSPEADSLRSVLGQMLGTKYVDAGGGWMIFGMPPSEIAVHPAETPAHEITVMCDELSSTMSELAALGVEFDGEPRDEGWGIVATMRLPGGVEMLLYEPRHPTAISD